jgi:CHAT domain-containing protein
MSDDDQHEQVRPSEGSGDLYPSQPPESTPAMLTSKDGHLSLQLQTWLDLPTVHEQRLYLEDHGELLHMHSEDILRALLMKETVQSEKGRQFHTALLLLQDARERGGTLVAVREAYINVYGGFVLDLPPWLEELEQRLVVLNKKIPEETAEARVALLQEALEEVQRDRASAPELLATLRRDLASAWLRHPLTDRSQAFETAIRSYEEVLHVYTLIRYPYQYAQVQNNLGLAYWQRIAGERRENLEQAIACYQETLHVYTLEVFPLEYARIQNNLALVYQERIAGVQRENLERAIACYQEALRIRTLEDFPEQYALTQNNLGLAYWNRIAGERRENLERAIACYHEALRVWTIDTFPFAYATAQDNLGIAYGKRLVGERRDNLERAIAYHREALRVNTLETFPFEYARAQNNLGFVYQGRIAGERRENLEQALLSFREALRVWTLEAFPFQYAMAQHNLGLVYCQRVDGEKQENLEKAIAYFREALRIYTLEAFPFYYAAMQYDLGVAYQGRIAGARQDNLAQAIVCYREALHVYSLEAFPRDYREAHLSLAEIEAQRGNWDVVRDVYIAALEAEDLLVILGAGTLGRDVILKEGREAAIRLGYVLHRQGRISEAAVAMERGRARGLAEAMAFDAAAPELITDEERRAHYRSVREALINAQVDLHAPFSQNLDEESRRRLDLEHTATYRQAKNAFDALVVEIRTAHDPANFLNSSLDAATILDATAGLRPGHALVYLAASPWGGTIVAALSGSPDGVSSSRFASLDLPELTEAWVEALMETHLNDGSERVIGGYALAQVSESFEYVCQYWDGETFQAKAMAFHAACRQTKQESTLDRALQEAMSRGPFARLAKQPLTELSRESRSLLRATLSQLFLRYELDRCLPQLSKTVLYPLVVWLRQQRTSSLTLIPCGLLAAFPLTAVILPDGYAVGEMFPTSMAPSARSLLHPATTRNSQAGVYALGDPHGNLPWSEAEALTLTALAHRYMLPAEVHVKRQATRERLLTALGSRWIVDASCHGMFDRGDFLRSALRLAKGEHITMSELLSHQTDVRGLRLLLLSACQTALLDLQGARDEVHSLAVAMLQAGARAVLGSLWAVDDKATYLLMVRFAQEWLPHMEQEPPAAALARAQAWLRTITNADLAVWHSTVPVPSMTKQQLTGITPVAHRLGQDATGKSTMEWQHIPVRGLDTRYQAKEAESVVRIEAEEGNLAACPYADPYYWAGFQVVGW